MGLAGEGRSEGFFCRALNGCEIGVWMGHHIGKEAHG